MREFFHDITFEQLVALYNKSPEDFYLKKQQLVDSYIASIPEEHRERVAATQNSIDKIVQMHDNPSEAIVDILVAAVDALGECNKQLGELVKLSVKE